MPVICSDPVALEWFRALLAIGALMVFALFLINRVPPKPEPSQPMCPIHKMHQRVCSEFHNPDGTPKEPIDKYAAYVQRLMREHRCEECSGTEKGDADGLPYG